MNRTKPSGIRFDPDKLEFIKGREKLKSNQQVVDLLMNRYWWEFKLPIPNHKEAPPLDLKNGPLGPIQPFIATPINQPIIQQNLPPKVAVDAIMRKYVEDRRDCSCNEEFATWCERLEADNRLTSKQKELVKSTR